MRKQRNDDFKVDTKKFNKRCQRFKGKKLIKELNLIFKIIKGYLIYSI